MSLNEDPVCDFCGRPIAEHNILWDEKCVCPKCHRGMGYHEIQTFDGKNEYICLKESVQSGISIVMGNDFEPMKLSAGSQSAESGPAGGGFASEDLDLSDLAQDEGSTLDEEELDTSDLEETDDDGGDDQPLDEEDGEIDEEMDTSDLEDEEEDLQEQPEVIHEDEVSFGKGDQYPDEFEKIYSERQEMADKGLQRVNPDYEKWRDGYSTAELKRGEYAVYKANKFDLPDLPEKTEDIMNAQTQYSRESFEKLHNGQISKEEFWQKMQDYREKIYARDLMECRSKGDENHQINYSNDGSSYMREYPDGTILTYAKVDRGAGNYSIWREYQYPDGSILSTSSLLGSGKQSNEKGESTNVLAENTVNFSQNEYEHTIFSDTTSGIFASSKKGVLPNESIIKEIEKNSKNMIDQLPDGGPMDKARQKIMQNYRHNPWSEE